MKDDSNGQEEAQDVQWDDRLQKPKAQPIAVAVDVSAYEELITECDERMKALEATVGEPAKTAETAALTAFLTDSSSTLCR